MKGRTLVLTLAVVLMVVALISMIVIKVSKENFLTLSALNVASAETDRQLRYYDELYGYDKERWERNTFPKDTQYLDGLIFGYSRGSDGNMYSLYDGAQ